MIRRESYLNLLRDFIDKPFIKVITGLRRCGKSVLLMMLRDELINKGIDENNIIYLNFFNYVVQLL